MQNKPPSSPGHEATDIRTRPVWIAGIGVAVCCIFIALAVTLLFNMLRSRARNADAAAAENVPASPIANSRGQFPGPRLQVAPEADLAAFRAREDDELNHYGWIDKKSGIVRIPIERAIELTAARGLPVNGQPGAPVPYRTSLDLQQGRPLEFPSPAPTATPWANPAATPMGEPSNQ